VSDDPSTTATGGASGASALDGIVPGLPAWQRALELQRHAATVGFDWPDVRPVLDKLAEELDEVRAEFAAGAGHARLEDEIGDLLFVIVNLARHAGVDFIGALDHANAKFERRFRGMERIAAAHGGALRDHPLAVQELLWRQAKRAMGDGQ
jgi:ATP diphosphatase